ncbi:hypothetical protein Tco_0511444 [Tanacetum coccineum]
MVDTFRRPPRGGAEEEQLGFLLSRMDGLILTNIPDHWVWSLEAIGELSVKSVCQLIDDSILPKEKLMRWWELEDIDLASYDDWLLWLNSPRLSKRLKEILEGVCYHLASVGELVGDLVGNLVGDLVGELVEDLVGELVGEQVGELVG